MFGKEQEKYQLGFCFFHLEKVEVKFYQEAKLAQKRWLKMLFSGQPKTFSRI